MSPRCQFGRVIRTIALPSSSRCSEKFQPAAFRRSRRGKGGRGVWASRLAPGGNEASASSMRSNGSGGGRSCRSRRRSGALDATGMQPCQHGTKRTALIEIRSMRRPAVRSRDPAARQCGGRCGAPALRSVFGRRSPIGSFGLRSRSLPRELTVLRASEGCLIWVNVGSAQVRLGWRFAGSAREMPS